MTTETFHFDNARLAQQLFNHDSHNLQSLEIELGVKATSREGWIKLEGPPPTSSAPSISFNCSKPLSRTARTSATANSPRPSAS